MLIDKPILNVEEAAHLLGTNDRNIYDLIRDGQLEAYKDPGNRRWRIKGESIQQYQQDMLNIYKNNIHKMPRT